MKPHEHSADNAAERRYTIRDWAAVRPSLRWSALFSRILDSQQNPFGIRRGLVTLNRQVSEVSAANSFSINSGANRPSVHECCFTSRSSIASAPLSPPR